MDGRSKKTYLGCSSAVKRQEIPTHDTTRVNLEDLMSEVSQTRKDKRCVSSSVRHLGGHARGDQKQHRDCGGAGAGRKGNFCSLGVEFLFCKKKGSRLAARQRVSRPRCHVCFTAIENTVMGSPAPGMSVLLPVAPHPPNPPLAHLQSPLFMGSAQRLLDPAPQHTAVSSTGCPHQHTAWWSPAKVMPLAPRPISPNGGSGAYFPPTREVPTPVRQQEFLQ